MVPPPSKSVFVIWQLPSQQNIKPCYAQANVAQMDALDDMLIYASRAGVDVTGMDIPTSHADWAFILKLAINLHCTFGFNFGWFDLYLFLQKKGIFLARLIETPWAWEMVQIYSLLVSFF